MKRKDFNYQQFSIGDFVRVSKLVAIGASPVSSPTGYTDKKKVISFNRLESIIGQIAGIKVFRLGKTHYDEDGNYFVSEGKAVICWEIRKGLLNKPVYAFPEDIELLPVNEVEELPVLCSRQPAWLDKWRDDLSIYSKDRPRDKDGRWTKI